MQQQNSGVIIKVQKDGDIRRITVASNFTFSQFGELVASLFPGLEATNVSYRYTDEDGDSVTIGSQPEWEEALRHASSSMKPFRVRIESSQAKNAAPSEAPSSTQASGEFAEVGRFLQGMGLLQEKDVESFNTELHRVVNEVSSTFGPQGGCHGGWRGRGFGPRGGCHGGRPWCGARARWSPYGRCGPCGPWAAAQTEAEAEDIKGKEKEDAHSHQEESRESRCCTYGLTGQEYVPQKWFSCVDCGLYDGEGCCEACAKECHNGHRLIYRGVQAAFCDCGHRAQQSEEGKEGHTCHALQNAFRQQQEERSKANNSADGDQSDGNQSTSASAPEQQQEEASMQVETESTAVQQQQPSATTASVSEEAKKPEEAPAVPSNTDSTSSTSSNGSIPVIDFRANLKALEEMGFKDTALNIRVLVEHRGNLQAAVADLVLLHHA